MRIFDLTRSEAKRTDQSSSDTPNSFLTAGAETKFISNVNPAENKLDSLLSDSAQASGYNSARSTPSPEPLSQHPVDRDETRIDVSLKIPLSSCPYILLLFNLLEPNPQAASSTEPVSETLRTVTVRIDIGLNGCITVPSVSGVCASSNSDTPAQPVEYEMATQKLREKLARVLETCEDLGLLVEWLIKWIRKQNPMGNP